MVTAVKKESSSTDDGRKKKYAVGSLLAVNLYGDDNYLEARLKSYNSRANKGKNCLWATMQYVHENGKAQQNDLNLLEAVDLSQDTIIKPGDDNSKDTVLGRRLIVQWNDGNRYPGVVAKCLKDKKDFVYIKYDDGDGSWYTLDPSKQISGQHENKNIKEKYPIGAKLCVAYHHDGQFYDCIIKKYHTDTKLLDKGQEWVYVLFCDSQAKEWIDLRVVASVKIEPDKIVTMDTIDNMNTDKILGKRVKIQWKDGLKYSGIVTRRLTYDENFVFIEYDDGDKCWCDLKKQVKLEEGKPKKKAKTNPQIGRAHV